MGAPSGQVGCHRSSVCSDWRILGKCDVPNRAFGEIARKGLTPSCRCAPRKPSSGPAKAPQPRTTRPGGAEAPLGLNKVRPPSILLQKLGYTILLRRLIRRADANTFQRLRQVALGAGKPIDLRLEECPHFFA